MCVCIYIYIYMHTEHTLSFLFESNSVLFFKTNSDWTNSEFILYIHIYTYTYIRGVTMCVFIFNFSVRGFRFGMHYKPNDERFLKPASAPDAQHKDSTSLIDPCEACSEWNPSWKTSVWPWPLYCNSVSGCYRTSYRLGHLCGEQQF